MRAALSSCICRWAASYCAVMSLRQKKIVSRAVIQPGKANCFLAIRPLEAWIEKRSHRPFLRLQAVSVTAFHAKRVKESPAVSSVLLFEQHKAQHFVIIRAY
jgi:hypothetical protein